MPVGFPEPSSGVRSPMRTTSTRADARGHLPRRLLQRRPTDRRLEGGTIEMTGTHHVEGFYRRRCPPSRPIRSVDGTACAAGSTAAPLCDVVGRTPDVLEGSTTGLRCSTAAPVVRTGVRAVPAAA